MAADGADGLTDAHRGSIGVALARLAELADSVRAAGVGGGGLEALEQEIEAMARATGARQPAPPQGTLQATLVQMLVLGEELRARRLRAYGQLGEDVARVVDEHAQRLVELTHDLIDELERRPG
jgi:hypothetical protein